MGNTHKKVLPPDDEAGRRTTIAEVTKAGDIAVASINPQDRSLGGATEDIDLLQPDDLTVVLHAALSAIRDDYDAHNWEAFERTVLGGEAAVDVAANLNITPVSVRQARFRILQRLRRELDGLL
jgi:hypothetical protein